MESLAADLATMTRRPLHPDHLAAMRGVGTVVDHASGTVLQKLGAPVDRFHHMLAGEVEAIDPQTGGRHGKATIGPAQFFGEISFLSGGRAVLGARAGSVKRVASAGGEGSVVI